MIRLDDETSATLEKFVDAHRLDGVVEALADICQAKADHLRSNWQDDSAAKSWERAARALERAVVKI